VHPRLVAEDPEVATRVPSSAKDLIVVLGVMVISAAPLLFLRRLSMARVGLAVVVTAVVLMAVNMIRLTAIGVAILAWGEGGFSVAHTYLGSLLTFIGTCLAGAAFVLVLIARPRPVTSVEAPV